MKVVVLLFLVFFIFGPAFSQEESFKKIDYKRIKKEIKKENSDFYYPKLMKKYQKGDSMSLAEGRHLYYGFIYQDAYTPYSVTKYRDSITEIFKTKMLFREDYRKIDRFSDSILHRNPFNLRVLSYKLFANDNLEDYKTYNMTMHKARSVIDAILSTGNGLKKETAIFVINPSHEYDILGVLGFEFGDHQSLIEHYDYLKLAKNEKNIEGLYFDVSASLNAMERMLK